jgi:hypothetical protein
MKNGFCFDHEVPTRSPCRSECLNMEPKKEHIEHEENGKRIERTTCDDPDTDTHAEEIKIESTTDERDFGN